jgi:hypothetical protein
MDRIQFDAQLLAKLTSGSWRVECIDDGGRVLGYFFPAKPVPGASMLPTGFVKLEDAVVTLVSNVSLKAEIVGDDGQVVGEFLISETTPGAGPSVAAKYGFTDKELDEADPESDEGSITTAELIAKARSL